MLEMLGGEVCLVHENSDWGVGEERKGSPR